MAHSQAISAAHDNDRLVRLVARLALLTLVLQLASLGHWSYGPVHAGTAGLATHGAHCHGDNTACGGQPSLAGTYIERPLAVTMPALTVTLPGERPPVPEASALPLPDAPPRRA